MEQWKFHNPVFECDELNYDLLRYAPWSGHRNFTYDLVSYFKPGIIVELGSHYGCSAFTFAQAIKDNKIDAKLYAIDTWAGDDYTKNDYKENDVYLIFQQTVNKYYDNQEFNMLRMTFDEALDNFEDKSIDVLHIDGSHHYNDVKHDFYSWLPKVKDDGIILLHDISEDIVLGGKMGSNKFWNELKGIYDNCIDFDFSWGLGIIFLSENKFSLIKNVNLDKYQRDNNALAVQYKEELRKQYFELKDNDYYISSLKEQLEIKDSHLNKYSLDMDGKNKYINELNKQINNWKENVEGKDNYIEELKSNIISLNNGLNDYAKNVEGKNNYIDELEENIMNLNTGLDNYAKNVEGKDNYIRELEAKVKELDEVIHVKKSKIEKLEQQVASVVKKLEEEVNKSIFDKIFRK